MEIGLDKISITPPNYSEVSTLSGHAFEAIQKDIFCNVIALRDDSYSVLFVSLDQLWLDQDFSNEVLTLISTNHSIPKDNIILAATHAHSTPNILNNPINEFVDHEDYRVFLLACILKVVDNAFSNMVHGYCELSLGDSIQNINRRKRVIDFGSLFSGSLKTLIANRPNKKAPVDNKIIGAMFFDTHRIELGMIVNYTAHPTLEKKNLLSPDYPGFISELLSERYTKKFVTCFFQGFSGNVKPNLITYNSQFSKTIMLKVFLSIFDRYTFSRNLDTSDIRNYSKSLVTELDYAKNFISFSTLNILACKREVLLKLANPFLGKDIVLHINCLRITNKFYIITMNGEVFSEYAIWIRSLFNKYNIAVMLVGYCGGMIGYIPTSDALDEGGYEVEGSLRLFKIPTKFSKEIESDIKTAFYEILYEFRIEGIND